MPFCRAMLSAKRFIAGVGGRTSRVTTDSGAEQRSVLRQKRRP